MILIADSGSTKCSWVLTDEENQKVLECNTIGFNPYFITHKNILNHLKNSDLDDLKKNIKKVFFYGAGCSNYEMNNLIKKPLSQFFSNANVKIMHDLEAACLAMYDNKPNVTCILGTGSNCSYYDGENIEGDWTDLTISSSAKINLTATSDVHIPNNVGIVFGGDSEKIEGDGTDLTISANNLTIDAAADISLDAAGNDFKFLAGGTEILNITNSSSDVVIKPVVDAKDIIFQQRDGTEVARIEDNGTFNVVTDKLAINGTAVTSTAAELNILDGVTATASELNLLDGDTSVGSSITLVDADGVVVNDGGTMKTIPASDVKTYASGSSATKGFAIAAAIVFG